MRRRVTSAKPRPRSPAAAAEGMLSLEQFLAGDGPTLVCLSDNKDTGPAAQAAKVSERQHCWPTPRPMQTTVPKPRRPPKQAADGEAEVGVPIGQLAKPTRRAGRQTLWELMLWDADTSKLVRQEVTRLLREEHREQSGRGLPLAGKVVLPRQWVIDRERRAQAAREAAAALENKEAPGAVTMASFSRHHEDVAKQQAALQQREHDARELRRLVREVTREAQTAGPSAKQLQPALNRVSDHLSKAALPPRHRVPQDASTSGESLFPVPGYRVVLDAAGKPLTQPLRRAAPGVINVYDPPGKNDAARYIGTFEPDLRTRRFQLLCEAVHGLVSVSRLPAHCAAQLPPPPQAQHVSDGGETELLYAAEDLTHSLLHLTAARQQALYSSQRVRGSVRRIYHRVNADGNLIDPAVYVSTQLDLTAALMPSFSSRDNIAVAEDDLTRHCHDGKSLPDWDSFFRTLFEWVMMVHSRDEFPCDDSFERFFDSLALWLDRGNGSDDCYMEALKTRKLERVGPVSPTASHHSPPRRRPRRHPASAGIRGADKRQSVASEGFAVSALLPPRSAGAHGRPRGAPSGLGALESSLPAEYRDCMRSARETYHSGSSQSTGIRFGFHSAEETSALFATSAVRTRSLFGESIEQDLPVATVDEKSGAPSPQQETDDIDELLNYLAHRPSGAPIPKGQSARSEAEAARAAVTTLPPAASSSPRNPTARRSLPMLGARLRAVRAVNDMALSLRSGLARQQNRQSQVEERSAAGSESGVQSSGSEAGDAEPSSWELAVRRCAREQLRIRAPIPRAPGGGPASARLPPRTDRAAMEYCAKYRPSSALGGGSTMVRRQRIMSTPAMTASGPYGVSEGALRKMMQEAEAVLSSIPDEDGVGAAPVHVATAESRAADVVAHAARLRVDGDDAGADAALHALAVLRAVPHRYLQALQQLNQNRAVVHARNRRAAERVVVRRQRALMRAGEDVSGCAEEMFAGDYGDDDDGDGGSSAGDSSTSELQLNLPARMAKPQPRSAELEDLPTPRPPPDGRPPADGRPPPEERLPRALASRLLDRWPQPPPVPPGPKPLGLPTSPVRQQRDDARLERALMQRARLRDPQAGGAERLRAAADDRSSAAPDDVLSEAADAATPAAGAAAEQRRQAVQARAVAQRGRRMQQIVGAMRDMQQYLRVLADDSAGPGAMEAIRQGLAGARRNVAGRISFRPRDGCARS